MECVSNKLLGVIDCVLFTPKKMSLTAKRIWLTNLQILTNYKITREKYNKKKCWEKYNLQNTKTRIDTMDSLDSLI